MREDGQDKIHAQDRDQVGGGPDAASNGPDRDRDRERDRPLLPR